MSKIISVGKWKTGTKTLGACLKILGYEPIASHNLELFQEFMKKGATKKVVSKMLGIADRYAAFEDDPWFRIYKELDSKYPNSKFILTVRKDSQTWYFSLLNNHLRYESMKEVWRILSQRKIFIKNYEKHNEEVKRYFLIRPDDLLIVCWEKGDGWEKLCPFLGQPVPNVPFPHEHESRPLILELFFRICRTFRWRFLSDNFL